MPRENVACEQALLFGQAKSAPRGFAAHSRVLARLASLAQTGELARRLERMSSFSLSIAWYYELNSDVPISSFSTLGISIPRVFEDPWRKYSLCL